MAQDPKSCLNYLSKLEEVAQDILIDKEQMINYSRRSNALREAKCLTNVARELGINKRAASRAWKAFQITDEALIEEEINTLSNIKPKVDNMRNLEGKPESKFDLKPLSKDEVNAIKKILYTV
ncbi:p53 and DNA damage-regulated protein 1 [Trichonephila clavipes]|nr:p53 and DNA damage-regulated protein 1 [Trichonephila clavipes]